MRSPAVTHDRLPTCASRAETVGAVLQVLQTKRQRPLDVAPFAAALAGGSPAPGLTSIVAGAGIAVIQAADACRAAIHPQ